MVFGGRCFCCRSQKIIALFKIRLFGTGSTVASEPSYTNMHTTLYTLLQIPGGEPNPITFSDDLTSLASDSTKARLLITALLDRSLTHNSPEPHEREAQNGIFTNYMQFMDNVVRQWEEKAGAAGVGRLERIHEIVLEQNRGGIGDPVRVENRGTLSEVQ